MSEADVAPLPPGSVIGLMGGGQLGRMTAMAAKSLGYRVHALDPNPECPVRGLSDRFVQGAFDDAEAAIDLASQADVVTCEREDIGAQSLEAIEQRTRLRPRARVLQLVQDRGEQKGWLSEQGFPVGPFQRVADLDAVRAAVEAFGPDTRFKRCRGGFDGRAQWSAADTAAESLWQQAGQAPLIAEQNLDLAAELSVMVARSPGGEMVTFPAAHNFHSQGSLDTSVLPAMLPSELLEEADALAHRVAAGLDLIGLLAVEMFWTRGGELLVNELAPRPHNTFHSTEWACGTSQFEQLVRAICGLPLGEVTVRTPTAIVNLYGDLWLAGREGELSALLATPGTHLRLYDKAPRKRRKLGHLAFTAPTPEQAHAGAASMLRRLEAAAGVQHAV